MKKISVVVTTYNQEKYIAQTLDCILGQKECPEFEIIVGNDCSTDGSQKIIDEYAQKYPDIIKNLPREKNLGMLKNLKDCLKNCSGDYIAICEGDDYWSDELKLKKQYELFENNPKATLCFSDIVLMIEDTGEMIPHAPKAKKILKDIISTKEIILYPSAPATFSCCMYRKSAVEKIPESYFEDKRNADWLFNIYMLEQHDGLFLKDVCVTYRVRKDAQWSGMSQEAQVFEMIEAATCYNKLLNYKYTDVFLEIIMAQTASLHSERNESESKLPSIKHYFELELPISKRRKWFLKFGREKANV